jgi:hyperosmotically inducible protein
MTLTKHVLTAALAGAVFVAGPVHSATAAVPAAVRAAADDSDDALQSRIEKDLKKNSVLAPRNIDVDVEHGVVTLKGSVRDTNEKTRAARVATVRGVTRVDNRLEINPNIDRSKVDTAAQKTKEGLNKAVDATATAAEKTKEGVVKGLGKAEEGVSKGAEKTAEATAKAADKTTDATVTTRVKASFTGEQLLKDTAIDVDTNDHIVTLRGTVNTNEARMRAGELASRVDGVAKVVNDLVVR